MNALRRLWRRLFKVDEMHACGCYGWRPDPVEDVGHLPIPEAAAALSVPPAERGEGRFFSYTVHRRAGSANHGYEDAAAVDADAGVAAVSDGATLGGFSGLLAEALADGFVSERFRLERDEERQLWWRLARRRWFLKVRPLYGSLSASQQEKVDRGGAATFLGLRMVDEETARAYLVGDCALFWIRDGAVTEVHGPESFHNHPETLNANQADAGGAFPGDGETVLPGDMAALATDAMASYLQAERPWEVDPSFWESLMEMPDAAFEAWTRGLARDGRLDEDDYTLVTLRFPGGIVESDTPLGPRPRHFTGS